MATILDGKNLALAIRRQLKEKVSNLKKKGIIPGLAVLLVGDDAASQIYVRNKEKAAVAAGFYSVVERLDATITQEKLLQRIDYYNQSKQIHGILVQLPLPDTIDTETILKRIDPAKDVDGFHPLNLGKLLQKDETIIPCTPRGILKLLDHYQIDLVGKHVVMIGQSTIVGRPMALVCLNHGATVTVCHSRTKNLSDHLRQADIIISAVGKAHLVTKEDIKPHAVVIDVGINRLADGTLSGDVAFQEVLDTVSAITPVPGGVGPMTIAMLLEQTYLNACKKEDCDE